jgi:hypothetical protein
MHCDIAGLEVYGRPLESAELAAAYPGCQFQQEQRGKPILLDRLQEDLDLVGRPDVTAGSGASRRLDIARGVAADVLPRDRVDKST